MKKVYILFAILLSMFSLTSCKSNDDIVNLSFKSASKYDSLKEMNGRTVSINGYMATSSPADGSFIFLMNLPYQNCPFCVPNTSELSNTIEVYPKKNRSFGYTTQAITITGTLVVCDDKNVPFVDMYGYEFSFKIVDATYKLADTDKIGESYALLNLMSANDSDLVNDLYSMYNYVSFVCKWPTYFVNSTDTSTGYYLWASDAKNYLEKDGAQYNYGYKTGYFDSLIYRVKKISTTGFESLISNITKAQTLANKAVKELYDGNYTYVNQYVSKFGTTDDIYTLNIGEKLEEEYNNLYAEFDLWLLSFEF